MKTIEISDELHEYLMEVRHGSCAEAWYTAQLKLDLNDLDATIKSIIWNRDMWEAVSEGHLVSNRSYPWDSQSSTSTMITEEKK